MYSYIGDNQYGPKPAILRMVSFFWERLESLLLLPCISTRRTTHFRTMFTQHLLSFVALFCCLTTLNDDTFSFALPIIIPASTKCAEVYLPLGALPTECCPKPATVVKDFEPPVWNGSLRIRRAAHLLDEEYIKKYTRAVKLMKALPPDDPRSYVSQSSIHCAYCDGAFRQVNDSDTEIQIHFSWLFLPFHRYYVYFHERIMGKLLGDPDFALPYWSWDSPAGMRIPAIFLDPSSPLYDPVRNKDHLPPKIVDLDYDYVERNLSDQEQVRQNLAIMYRNMVANGKTGNLFFGKPYRVGSQPGPGGGSIEDVPHNSVHIWVGDVRKKNVEDMGNFYSSAKDPMFFPHHANVDRLWTLWRKLGGVERRALKDPDWLEASFIFYDENAEAVRVKIKDCLRTRNLGYKYEHIDVPWLQTKPKPREKKVGGLLSGVADTVVPEASFPVVLDHVVTTRVKRGKFSRSKAEKDEEDEILVIEGIEFRRDIPSKFHVYVNEVEWSKCSPENTEFAGSFLNVPNLHKSGLTMMTSLQLSITELLHDLGADDDESVLVTLVPRYGKEHIKVGGIKIVYESN